MLLRERLRRGRLTLVAERAGVVDRAVGVATAVVPGPVPCWTTAGEFTEFSLPPVPGPLGDDPEPTCTDPADPLAEFPPPTCAVPSELVAVFPLPCPTFVGEPVESSTRGRARRAGGLAG